METIKLQATIKKTDIPYIKRFLGGIAEDVSFDEDDFFYELFQEDLEAIRKGKEEIKKGLTSKSEEVQKEIRAKYGDRMGI